MTIPHCKFFQSCVFNFVLFCLFFSQLANAQTPGGSAYQLQYNNSGSFGGVANSNVTSAGNIGVGTTLSTNLLDVAGGVSIGTLYAGYQTAPLNGLIVQGNVGIGSTLVVQGNIGIGTAKPVQALDVNGSIALQGQKFLWGSAYSFNPNLDNVFLGNNAGNTSGATDGADVGAGTNALNSIGPSTVQETAFGAGALQSDSGSGQNAAFGYVAGASLTSGTGNTFLGNGAGNNLTLGSDNICVGVDTCNNRATAGNNNVVIGDSAAYSNYSMYSIALGFNALATNQRQMVVGDSGGIGYVTDLYLGSGVTSTASNINNVNIHATGGAGSNTVGANLTLSGGQSTGNANGGSIIFQTSPAGSSGSGANSLIQAVQIISSGNMGIGSTNPGQILDVQGTVRMAGFNLSKSPTNGYVLTSDGSGNGTWTASSKYDFSANLVNSINVITNSSTNLVGGDTLNVVVATSAAQTETLPAPSTGEVVSIQISNSSTQLVTIHDYSSETIDGSTTRIMWAGETAILYSDGTNWYKIAGKSLPMQAEIGCTVANPCTATSVPSATVTTVTLGNTLIDNTGHMADPASNQINIVRPGLYLITGQTTYQQLPTSDNTQARINKNGVLIANTSIPVNPASASDCYPAVLASTSTQAVVSDYITMSAYQTSGSTQSTYAPEPKLTVTEIPQW